MRKVLGLVACIAGIAASHAAEPLESFELALVDMQGQKKVLGTVSEPVFAPRVSPDGKRVAYEAGQCPAAGRSPDLRHLRRQHRQAGQGPHAAADGHRAAEHRRGVVTRWRLDRLPRHRQWPAIRCSGKGPMAGSSPSCWWMGAPQRACTKAAS